MRILMLGNSFTFAHDMPSMLAELTGAEVLQITRGDAYLAEQLDPQTTTGERTRAALEEKHWDYVILQEMSYGPITSRDCFFKSVSRLCDWIREKGAVPILYATWAYQKDSQAMADMGISYEDMAAGLEDAYHEAAEQNHALVADVGRRFYELAETQDLYARDGQHPSKAGSHLAAQVIAEAIRSDQAGLDET